MKCIAAAASSTHVTPTAARAAIRDYFAALLFAGALPGERHSFQAAPLPVLDAGEIRRQPAAPLDTHQELPAAVIANA